jgi:hypothetical protein
VRTDCPRVAERPVDKAELGVQGRMHPRGRPADRPGVALPGVVADLARARRAPEMPDDVAVVGVQGERGAAVPVVSAAVEDAVVMGHGNLLHVAEPRDLPLPADVAGLLVQRDDPTASGVGEDLAVPRPRRPVGSECRASAGTPTSSRRFGRPPRRRCRRRTRCRARRPPPPPCSGWSRWSMPPSIRLTHAAPRRRMLPWPIRRSDGVVLIAVVAADLREVTTAGRRTERAVCIPVAIVVGGAAPAEAASAGWVNAAPTAVAAAPFSSALRGILSMSGSLPPWYVDGSRAGEGRATEPDERHRGDRVGLWSTRRTI